MHRKCVLSAICILLLGFAAELYGAGNVTYTKRRVRGIPVHVVTANLNSPDVRVSPAIARYGIGTSEGFGSMLSRLQPAAAITGTYFCVNTLIPVGHIVIDGQLLNTGQVGTAVSLTYDNRIEFGGLGSERAVDWTRYSCVVSAGPRLVRNRVAHVAPWAEGFTDRALYKKARRSALGVTRHNKLLLVAVNRPVYLSTLARIMRDMGAVDAVNLDGGTSTALSYRNRVFSHPARRMTNLIVVYESAARFTRIKPRLAPSLVVAEPSSASNG